MADTPLGRARENVTGIVSMLVTGIWLAAMFTGQDWWLPALLVGYIVVVPLVAILAGEEDHDDAWTGERSTAAGESTEDGSDDALETLRRRYAAGELTDAQFERKLERLLETETLEAVEDRERARTMRDSLGSAGAPDRGRELEDERER